MKAQPNAEIVKITPLIAAEWLAKNIDNNRAPTQYKIAAYSRDMREGKWHLNGETIKFDVLDRLIDGQNRLHAVISSGAVIENFVTFGLAADTGIFGSIDAGRPRSFADRLMSEGRSNPKTLAAVVRRTLMWKNGLRTSTGGQMSLSSDELSSFLSEHPGLEHSAALATRIARDCLVPASVIGLCHYLFSELNSDQAEWFMLRLSTGDNLSASHPVLALRNRLVKERQANGRTSEVMFAALTIRAWNAYRRNEPLSRIQLPVGGLTAANYPVPE